MLAGNILMIKTVRLQTEYMGTCRTRVTVHGVPADISEDQMGAFFTKYREVNEVSVVMSKSGIGIEDIILQVILTRQS